MAAERPVWPPPLPAYLEWRDGPLSALCGPLRPFFGCMLCGTLGPGELNATLT